MTHEVFEMIATNCLASYLAKNKNRNNAAVQSEYEIQIKLLRAENNLAPLTFSVKALVLKLGAAFRRAEGLK